MKTDKAEFTITGAVARKFVAGSGKFGKLVMETSIGGRRAKHDIKFFDQGVIQQIDLLGVGEFITVTGKVGSECVKDKSGQEVKADGYSIWVASLVGEKLDNGGVIKKTPIEKRSSEFPPDDDDIPA